MECNKKNILNKELIVLNYFTYLVSDKMYAKLLLRCSKGHILMYRGDYTHIKY